MRRRVLLVTAFQLVLACRPQAVPQTVQAGVPQDCLEAPPAMSVTEASAELTRFARETRANLMARLRPAPTGHTELFATLHPPGLSLLEATLASPAKAQRLDRGWMQRHLLTAHVEIHARKPIEQLAEGELDGVELMDGEGKRTRALFMTVREDSGGWTYRLHFDPLFFDHEQERTSVTFRLPLRGNSNVARSRWRLSRSILTGTDDLPVLYWMTRVRGVRRARWALLLGDREAARGILSDELRCAPDLDEARALLAALARLGRLTPRLQTRKVSLPPLPEATREDLGHDPVQDVALRAAMLARLTPLARVGVVSSAGTTRARQALDSAVQALEKGEVGWALATALTDVDRALATLLDGALDGAVSSDGEVPTTLVLHGIAQAPAQQVAAELERRVLHANYDLVPRWVKGPKGFAARGGGVFRLHLRELRPVLRNDQQVVAKLRRRLGWGWIHPGLPAGSYRTTFADHSGDYWRRRVLGVGQGALEAYRPLARQVLQRELYSPEPSVAALAMGGLVEQGGAVVARALLALRDRMAPGRHAALLRAVALVRDPAVSQAIAVAARSSEAAVRAGAMDAVGLRGLSSEMILLRVALKDPSLDVASAGLEGLLRAGDRTALAEARRWLAGADPGRRERVLALAARPELRLSGLAHDLLQLGRRASGTSSSNLVRALVVLGARAKQPLNRLYDSVPALRIAVAQSARGPAFEPLLRRVLGEESGPRRVAALNLARLKRPPDRLLTRLLQDRDSDVRLAAHVGLARLGRADSLLALGVGARAGCWARGAVLPTLCRALEAGSRARLLIDTLQSGCPELLPVAWELVQRYQPREPSLLGAALGHNRRAVRVLGALAVLGLRSTRLADPALFEEKSYSLP